MLLALAALTPTGCLASNASTVPPLALSSAAFSPVPANAVQTGSAGRRTASSTWVRTRSAALTRENTSPANSAENRASRGGNNVAAAAALPNSTAPRQWQFIVLHHSATPEGTVASIDAAHRERRDAAGNPWLGIGYHFVIGNGQGIADGVVEPTFRWTQQLHGAHSGDRLHNDYGIGICLVGDLDQQPPTPRQVAAAQELIIDLKNTYRIDAAHIVAHRDLSATNCPGKFFSLAQFVSPEVVPNATLPAAR